MTYCTLNEVILLYHNRDIPMTCKRYVSYLWQFCLFIRFSWSKKNFFIDILYNTWK